MYAIRWLYPFSCIKILLDIFKAIRNGCTSRINFSSQRQEWLERVGCGSVVGGRFNAIQTVVVRLGLKSRQLKARRAGRWARQQRGGGMGMFSTPPSPPPPPPPPRAKEERRGVPLPSPLSSLLLIGDVSSAPEHGSRYDM